ncbi:MAG: hypothetical protein IPI95_11575 [Flavobacteriales bacterium]|nr:hypothetical protein [Flavobacteriales bacterium]
MLRSSLLLFVLAGMASGISAQPDCSQTSTGHIPINDLGTGTYLGMTGGLYANGSISVRLRIRPPGWLSRRRYSHWMLRACLIP